MRLGLIASDACAALGPMGALRHRGQGLRGGQRADVDPAHEGRHVRVIRRLRMVQHALDERPLELARRLVAGLRVALERLHHHGAQLLGDVRVDPGRVGDLALLHRAQHGQLRVPIEQPASGEHLPEDDAQREDVRARVHVLAARLLGRHVRELALEHARRGQLVARLGDAEVRELHRPIERDEDVVRGDVAVDEEQRLAVHLEPVGVVKAASHLRADVRHEHRRHGVPQIRALLAQVRERAAAHVLHGQVVRVLVLGEVEDLHHVGVVELRGQPRLGDEHVHEAGIARHEGADPLDDHFLLEALRALRGGEVDLRHPSLGELLADDVLADLGACRERHEPIPLMARTSPSPC